MTGSPEYGSQGYADIMQGIREAVQPRYTDLPYHNFGHAEHTAAVGVELGLRSIANGTRVSLLAIEAGGYIHDADFHLPLPKSIRSKELRSSRIGGEIFRSLGLPRDELLTMQAAIRPTELGVKCRTPEAVILRRADLDNTTSNYFSFLLNTYRLYREAGRLTGSFPPLPGFLLDSVRALRTYYAEDLSLGPFDEMHEIEKALSNIARLETETASSFLGKVLGKS